MNSPQQFQVAIEDGLCVCTWTVGAEVTGRDAKDALAAEVAALAGRRMPLLVRLAGIRSMDREARQVFGAAGPDTGITAVALVATSPVQRVLANFFLTLSRPPVPVRMFTDDNSARRWLLTGQR